MDSDLETARNTPIELCSSLSSLFQEISSMRRVLTFPLDAGPAEPEICANGFRNPWRCGFDRETDELYCGDVGYVSVEEVDIVE